MMYNVFTTIIAFAFGFIPIIDAPADLANAGIYAVNGDYAMAGISVIAVVPGFGDAAKI